MSSREIEQRKQELLIKLLALEKKGVNLTKSYSLKILSKMVQIYSISL